MSRPRSTASRGSTRACSRRWRRRASRSRGRSCRGWARRWPTVERAGRRWSWTTCTCSITARASTRSKHSRDTSRTARSWPSRRAARPALPLAASAGAGPGARDRAGRPPHGRGGGGPAAESGRRWTCRTPRSPSSPSSTEGWSAGLYLAALSIRARGHKAKGAAAFSGSDRLVSDYLQSELLAHLSADELRFLTRTAVLERLSGPLCDAVLEESGSASSSGVAGALQPVPGAAGR